MPFSSGVGNLMVPSPRSRAWCLRCALIALSIHGMTPDPRDVTSGAIPMILRSILEDGVPAAADRAPPVDDALDENPDDVCTPPSAAARRVAPDPLDDAPPPHRMTPFPHIPRAGTSRPRTPPPAPAACLSLARLARFIC
jgi:hypothetical protein